MSVAFTKQARYPFPSNASKNLLTFQENKTQTILNNPIAEKAGGDNRKHLCSTEHSR